MLISFSPRKNAINRRKHSISLQRAEDFDLTTALIFPEDSQDYGELRIKPWGFSTQYFMYYLMLRSDFVKGTALAVPQDASLYAPSGAEVGLKSVKHTSDAKAWERVRLVWHD